MLKPEHSFFYYLTEHKIQKGKYKGLPYGFPSWKSRWCTTYLKLQSLYKFEQNLIKRNHIIVSYIGYELGETKRALKTKKRETANKIFRFPLIEDFKMTGRDCLKYSYQLGFDWDGAYKYVTRLSCYTCPFSRLREIQFLIEKHPDLWDKIKQAERHLKELGVPFWKFNPHYSCEKAEKLIFKKQIKLALFK